MKKKLLTSIIALLSLIVCASAAGAAASKPADDPFYFAIVSDIHLMPDMKHEHNVAFEALAQKLGSHKPGLDFVVATGDWAEHLDLPYGGKPEAYTGDNAKPVPMHEYYKSIIEKNIRVPYYNLAGNHEFYWKTMWNPAVKRPQIEKILLQDMKKTMPALYYNVEHKGFNLVMLFSMATPENHTESWSGGFDDKQLDWLEGQLKRGMPTILFFHHYPASPLIEKITSKKVHILPASDRIYSIVEKYKGTIKTVFVGHGGYWCEDKWFDIPLYMTGSPFDPPGYHLIKAFPVSGQVSVVNRKDITYVK